jgi:flavin reductase (DIM6/NTAB) family NADH-FMN oxidoreductase RutF
MPIPVDQFKHVMRQWASGVTVVTMQTATRKHGLTVGGFLSVSLEPPLVLISIGEELTSEALLKESAAFGVNFLREDQSELSDRFAGRLGAVDRLDGVPTLPSTSGAPILKDCLAWLDCRVVQTHVAGDHVLTVGEVMAAGVNAPAKPLLSWNTDYRKLE